ncbi:hypothetical protein AAVH_20315 [Aphelenchoides avenae]|nr:hypothetical protein AAVH_20315 [Aphelenchus avenae]
MKLSCCTNPNCDKANCIAAPAAVTLVAKTGEIVCSSHGQQMNDILARMVQSFQENPRRHIDLCKRAYTIVMEENAIKEKLSAAKPGEKKRLSKELEINNAECAQLKDLLFYAAGSKPTILM